MAMRRGFGGAGREVAVRGAGRNRFGLRQERDVALFLGIGDVVVGGISAGWLFQSIRVEKFSDCRLDDIDKGVGQCEVLCRALAGGRDSEVR